VEILERRHVRDRAQPEIPRESYEYLHDGDRVAEKLERLDLDPYPREEIVESYRRKKDDIKRAAAKSRGRPRSRGMSEMEDAYYSTEESDEEYESESDEIVEPVRRQKKRSISRHEYETRKEPIPPRSRHPKEEKRVHQSTYEEEVYPKSGSSRENHMSSHRGSARYEPPPPRPRHRSHYHVDIDDVESDESDESEGISARREARIMMQKERIKNKHYAARNRAISPSSPSSLSSSADLSESELPQVPLPVPVPPPFYKEPGKKHRSLNHGNSPQESVYCKSLLVVANDYRMPSLPRVPNLPQAPVPPRVPDLETVLSERDARQR
jgi:hypothetical protein